MESGVLRNEREPEAPAPSGRVHRESGRPPPLRGDLTLIWMGRGMATLSRFRFPTPWACARHCTALQAQCFTGPTLQSGNTQARGGTSETSLLPAPTPEAWAPTLHCASSAVLHRAHSSRVGITKEPGRVGTLRT